MEVKSAPANASLGSHAVFAIDPQTQSVIGIRIRRKTEKRGFLMKATSLLRLLGLAEHVMLRRGLRTRSTGAQGLAGKPRARRRRQSPNLKSAREDEKEDRSSWRRTRSKGE